MSISGNLRTVAVAGNPNCGKTTLFNGLTGLRYKVANYPGVTVERKHGVVTLPEIGPIDLVDLPGIYSLSGRSIDEQIATATLLGDKSIGVNPECIVAVVDSSNLERNLYLVTQLIDLGTPVVLALNMGDIAEERGIEIHKEILARELDVDVVPIIAKSKTGLDGLLTAVSALLQKQRRSAKRFYWAAESKSYERYSAELGREYRVANRLPENEDAARLIGSALLADSIPAPSSLAARITESRNSLRAEGVDPLSLEATARYQWINQIVRKSVVQQNAKEGLISERLDRILSHRWWGTVVFIAVMATIFQSIFTWAQVPMDLIDQGIKHLGEMIGALLPEGILRSLVIDGVLAGVGSVLVFVPQIALLFLFLGLLEDSGYLSRAAFLMDRLMRPFGLQGRSFIPLLSSFACAIPGIMSTRTIPSWTDRIATIMVAPLMSCSARLPVFAVLISAFVPAYLVFGMFSLQGLVLLGMYFLGIAGAALVAWLLKLSVLRGKPALFVMEMPPLRMPSAPTVLREVWDRVLTFLRSAGTVILACSIVLWALASFPRPPDGVTTGRVQYSYAGKIGHAMEPLLKPIGLNWEVGVGVLASFAAREVFVSSLATVYNLDDSGDSEVSLIEKLKEKRENGSFRLPSALSLMVFYVFACQCMSTLAVCKRETASWKWPAFMFAYMTVLAYFAAFVTYQVGVRFL